MSPRPNVSEERKKQILDAAITVFTRLGLHKARMDDIVEESGLSKGTLYWYFKSKDDIITSIMENIFSSSLEQFQLQPVMEGGVRKHLTIILNNSIEDVKQLIQIRPLVYDFISIAFRDESVQKAIQEYFKLYMNSIVPIVQQGIEDGEFRQMDANKAAMALGALFEGTILLWLFDPNAVNIERQFQISLDLLLDGFETKKP